LKIVTSGTSMTAYLNGVLKISGTMAGSASGKPGVRAYSGGESLLYDYDDLMIR
jgi:hypothetical protein